MRPIVLEYISSFIERKIFAAQVNENNVLQTSKRIRGENDAILERIVIYLIHDRLSESREIEDVSKVQHTVSLVTDIAQG